MEKYLKITSLLILASLLFLSCGFKKINHKDNKLIYIRDINLIGNSKIAYNLKNNILLISNKDAKYKYDVDIKLEKKKITKIKNKKGKITRYTISISLDLQLINLDNVNNKINKTFIRSADYDVASMHSDTIVNEKNVTKNITQQLSSEIINFITMTMKNQ